MTPDEYINLQTSERQATLTAMHNAIMNNDATVVPVVEAMMGKEMILYKERGYMKYGLASVKNYLSLHCLPMYMNAPLHQKYEVLLPEAKFQKGCINLTDAEQLPVDIAVSLIADCARISIADMLEARKRKPAKKG